MGPITPVAPSPDPFRNHPHYEKVQEVGKGSFGLVLLAKDRRSGQHYAVKCLERGNKITEHIEREVTNHRRLNHDHIIQFHEVFLTPSHLCIVMEYAPSGNLQQYINSFEGSRFEEPEARWVFQQLMHGLDYCQRMGIANRDIKLENTLVDANGEMPMIKLCDFGVSKAACHSAPGTLVGTPAYVAPEILLNTQAGKTYNAKMSDIWSCGVMLYRMLVGRFPFGSPGSSKDSALLQRVFDRIVRAEYDQAALGGVSPACRDLLARILVADPHQRITMDGIFDHPWFKQPWPWQPGPLPLREQNIELAKRPLPAGLQTEDEVKQLIQAARTPVAKVRGGADGGDDDDDEEDIEGEDDYTDDDLSD